MKKSLLIGCSAVILASAISATLTYKVSQRNNTSQAQSPSLGAHAARVQETQVEEVSWTCSMHPQIVLKDKVPCPICGMELIPLKKGTGNELSETQIEMSEHAQKIAQIETWPVEQKSVSIDIKLPGKVSYDESQIKTISARYSGRVDRLYLDITGAPIKKGEHLYDIYSPQIISAQEELIQAEEALKKLDNNSLAIIRQSSEESIKTAKEKLSLYGFSDEQISKVTKQGKALDQITTHSEISGIVLKKHINEGQYVKEGNPIYTIADPSQIWLELEAYETDLPWIHYAQKVSVTSQAFPDQTFEGQVSFIEPELNEKTRTVKIRVYLENKDKKLKPGMFVRAKIQAKIDQYGQLADHDLSGKYICPMHPEIVSDNADTCSRCEMKLEPAEKLGFMAKKNTETLPLVIPSSAALITGKRAVVYVKSEKKEQVFEGREIEIATKAGNYYVVKSGLKEGELVVSKGAFKIDSALQIQAKTSMMSGDAKHQLGKDSEHSKQQELFTRPELKGNHPFKAELEVPLKTFNEINRQLSLDKIDKLPSLAKELEGEIKAMSFDELNTEEKSSWKALRLQSEHQAMLLSKAKSIDEARTIAHKLNKTAIKAIKHFGSPIKLNIGYCSMAFNDTGAEWIQTADRVENPYWGSQMYRCGSLTKAAGSADIPSAENDHSEHHHD